mgnify:CR=1 FL=1
MKLNVFANGKEVGILDEVASEGSLPDLRFQYNDDALACDAISLTMPVRKAPYIQDRLHPCFDMLLPEGVRRQQIEKLGKLTRIDDFGLLALVGSNTVGRIQVSEGHHLDKPITFKHRDVMLCKDGLALFNSLLDKGGFKSGISGVQPKVLAKIEDPLAVHEEESETCSRTITSSTDIIKTANDEFPGLVQNEYICLHAARLANIDVPDHDLSRDGALIVIDRFDIAKDGHHLGFEEMASLLGVSSDKKYESSFDLIALEIEDRVNTGEMMHSLKELFKQMAFNILIRNGDTHLKNFGLIYDGDDVQISPAYDLVTTTAYIEDDIPALALSEDNYSKRWWSKKELFAFGSEHCYLKKKQMKAILKDINTALLETQPLIDKLMTDHDAFKPIGEKMKTIWSDVLTDYELTPLTVTEPSVAPSATGIKP